MIKIGEDFLLIYYIMVGYTPERLTDKQYISKPHMGIHSNSLYPHAEIYVRRYYDEYFPLPGLFLVIETKYEFGPYLYERRCTEEEAKEHMVL